MTANKELTVVLQDSGLEVTKLESLLNTFGKSFAEAKELVESSKAIVVTEESQKVLTTKAKTQRLKLKNIRVDVEKTRKGLKEQSLREGKAIDGIANIIKALIVPAEEHLEQQEKFAELKAAERREAKFGERVEQLSKYVEDVSLYNIREMEDEAYDKLLANAKDAHEAQLKAAKELEEKRIADEKAAVEEQERIRKENEQLKKEAAEREAKAEAERVEREKVEAKEREEREAADRRAENERVAEHRRLTSIKVDLLEYAHNIKTVSDANKNLAQLEGYFGNLPPADADNEMVNAAYHKSRAEILELRTFIVERDAKAEVDRKAAQEAKEKAIAEEEERKSLLAPDKEKLLQFAKAINMINTEKLPAVKSNEAQKIVNYIQLNLRKLEDDITNRAGEL